MQNARGQHAIHGLNRQRLRLNRPRGVFQHPVAAQCSRSSEVGRGRHVGAGGVGQLADEGFAGVVFGHVAAIDQQICIRAERVFDGGPLGVVVAEVGLRQGHIAQVDLSGRAVGEQVHCINAAAPGQGVGQQGHAVGARCE